MLISGEISCIECTCARISVGKCSIEARKCAMHMSIQFLSQSGTRNSSHRCIMVCSAFLFFSLPLSSYGLTGHSAKEKSVPFHVGQCMLHG